MTYYERNLPHWHPEGKAIFITWRLHGSLPIIVVRRISADSGKSPGRRFLELDRALDKPRLGPLWLADARVAACVVEGILHGQDRLGFYDLHAYVVMANHVHMLMCPKVSVVRITNGLKGVTARNANAILGRIGMRFWQEESFDHWVRSESQFDRVRGYIERNPVSAGLVKVPKDWKWSSAAQAGVNGGDQRG